mmetsp:Transcript_4159/g.9401  ORF Transcript_4159/g.9401 Transcript_4159/m.9401 type:complete len:122 (-) Transcript_4159:2226-2591(-)
MENTFIPQAIEIVGKAIEADNNGEYEKALGLYRDSLGRFTMGLKYEKNEAKKETRPGTRGGLYETSGGTQRLHQQTKRARQEQFGWFRYGEERRQGRRRRRREDETARGSCGSHRSRKPRH